VDNGYRGVKKIIRGTIQPVAAEIVERRFLEKGGLPPEEGVEAFFCYL